MVDIRSDTCVLETRFISTSSLSSDDPYNLSKYVHTMEPDVVEQSSHHFGVIVR